MKVHELVTENLNRYHETHRKLAHTDKSTPFKSLRRSARLSKAFKNHKENSGPRRTLFSRSIESEQIINTLRSSIRLSKSPDLESMTKTPCEPPTPEPKRPSQIEFEPKIDQVSTEQRKSNLADLTLNQGGFKMPQQSPPKAIKPRRSMRISNIFQTRLSIMPPETSKPDVRKRKVLTEPTHITGTKRKIKAAVKCKLNLPYRYHNQIPLLNFDLSKVGVAAPNFEFGVALTFRF